MNNTFYKGYYEDHYLAHHGILGMKWGVRRYQNPDGSLTDLGRQRVGQKVQKMEKNAIKKSYKQKKKNGETIPWRRYRVSTGENYDKAEANFEKKVLNDQEYQRLSKAAFDAEKKRLLSEKGHDDDYGKFVSTKEYRELLRASEKASKAKDERLKKLSKDYIDTIKDAKVKDLKIDDKYKSYAKQFVSEKFYDFVYDGNLEYNPDSYYEKGIEKLKYKKG